MFNILEILVVGSTELKIVVKKNVYVYVCCCCMELRLTQKQQAPKQHRKLFEQFLNRPPFGQKFQQHLKGRGVSNPIAFELCLASTSRPILINFQPKVEGECFFSATRSQNLKTLPVRSPSFKTIAFLTNVWSQFL